MFLLHEYYINVSIKGGMNINEMKEVMSPVAIANENN